MKSQEILVVARRFWPHAGLTELSIAELALNLADAGNQVTVATIQWSRDWSQNISFHGIPVIRFTRPVAGPWSSFRYARSLAKHFATKSYDNIIVSGLGDEASAVMRCASEYTPVVLHVDEGFDDVAGKIHRKHVETCLAADAVVANSQPVAEYLRNVASTMPEVSIIEPGMRQTRIHYTGDCAERRRVIRSALTKAHPVLRIEPDFPLVVSCPRMNNEFETDELLDVWPNVLAQFPAAKLWLVGDGKRANKIWQNIVDRELTYSVLMPGCFDELTDVFEAANLYVHCGDDSQTGDGMIRAMSAGLPATAKKK